MVRPGTIPRTPARHTSRYWLVYLFLRFTGARLGEIVQLDDSKDIDFRSSEVRIITLKRRGDAPKRMVPVPDKVISELATFLAAEPNRRGSIFKVDPKTLLRKSSGCRNIGRGDRWGYRQKVDPSSYDEAHQSD
ncbi:hypothetical protein DPQ33_18060 [Oceanidesulfovibrio indonesiensis]|uniref:Tyr recombinase domain-containing protein n=1 Tax=Oceanidesulfovibrio indonesiensis TaxID=54767 RepID=A0A7M3M9X6_9BACT|nr:hypothetical protein DPQ33_18060 [Oceanidesulfovibrio indonesiensis]